MTGGPQLMIRLAQRGAQRSTPAQKAPVEVRQAAMPSRSTISLYFYKFNLEASSDYCERAVGVQGRLEDNQERLDDCRKVCIGGGRLVTLSTGP